MIWFNYELLTFSNVYNWVKAINNYSIIELSILLISILFLVLITLYVIPIIKIYNIESEQNALKVKNKKMLRRIALQKDIEDAIAEELKLTNNN